MKKKILFIIAFCISLLVHAKVELPALIQSGMVLQQQSEVTLWGKASPNKSITVSPSWLSTPMTIKSNSKGEWEAKVLTTNAGGPYSITFDDGQQLKIDNILLGEVWLCAGQSNMEFPVEGFLTQPAFDTSNDIVRAKESTPIRLFSIERCFSESPLTSCNGKWCLNNSKSVSTFSAVGYYFGKYLQEVLDVPVGLINVSVGGSNVQAWMSADILKLFSNVDMSLLKDNIWKKNKNKQIVTPTLLYNGMLNPLKGMTFKGVIWYQGEANKRNCKEYVELFPAFVEMLRKDLSSPNLPFYYTQIAPYGEFNSPYNNTVLMRETQSKLMNMIPNCGMAVLTDAGVKDCIHPPYKKLTAERLAYWALAKTYHRDGFLYQSPTFAKIKVDENKAYLHFENAKGGLTDKYEGLHLFEIAGADKKFYPAKAKIVKDDYQVVVWSDEVEHPVAVRYAFKNYVKGDLFGISGLPVSSFRTDDWNIPNVDNRNKKVKK